MRAPASTGTNKLPTLEDNSQSTSGATSQGYSKSHNSHSNTGSRDGSSGSNAESGSTNKPRMKRSPYLSVMSLGSTKESEDLVALLSRPRSNSSTQKKLDEIIPSSSGGKESTGASVLMESMNVDNDRIGTHGEVGTMGGRDVIGGSKGLSHGVNLDTHTQNNQKQLPGSDAFFNLKRPSNKPPSSSNSSGGSGSGFELNHSRSTTPSVTPVSSGGTEFTNAEYGTDEGSGSGSGGTTSKGSGSGVDARMKQPPPPSTNRGLGIGTQLKSALRIGGSKSNLTLDNNNPPSTSNMNMGGKSNVSFSNTTKMASTKGLMSFPTDNADYGKYGNATFNFGTTAGGTTSGQGGLGMTSKQVAQMRQFQIGGSGSGGGSGQGGMGGAKYSAQNMMRKSQSIAAPQFMLTHTQPIGSKSGCADNRGNSTFSSSSSRNANESFGNVSTAGQSVATTTSGNSGGSGEVGKSFPIFLGKLSTTPSDKQQSDQQQSQQHQPKHVRQRSQSTTTLQYYASHNQNTCIQKDPAQQLLQAAGMTGTTRPSTLNLTFREMLDEGDGTENDLNSRLRNQQWKDFSNFSNQFEKSNPMLRSVDEHSSIGSKDSSMGENSASTTGACGRSRKSSMGSATSSVGGQMSLSGSKRSIGSGEGSGTSGGSTPSRGNQQWSRPYGLAGSHRQAVSVNDLAVLRRAASRMKMNNVTGGGMGGGMVGSGSQQKLPGETLGGSLLSRINSTADSSIGGGSYSGTATAPPTTILSPMEQMMAKKQSQQQTSTQQPQTSEMFMKQFNLAMSSGPGQYSVQPSPSTVYNTTSSASMGRQVRSVGAGLAYGRVNMTTNANRLSRFNLGNMNRTNSRLSEISSAGSGSSHTGIGTPRGNEEWDLG